VLPAGAKAHFGHDTLYIHADATTAPLTIEFPTAETAQYAACSGMLTGLISQCGEDQAYVFKWDDNKGYVMDNNGVVQMLSTGINDNTVKLISCSVKLIDYSSLVIGLEYLAAESLFFCTVDDIAVESVDVFVSIDTRPTLTEKVEVRAVQHQ
jgi:hypothetical protein